jgi:hypothetical protein
VKLLVWTGSAVLAFLVAMMFSVVAIVGDVTPSSGAMVVEVGDIPPDYLVLYQQAGEASGIDWFILAAIGKIETDHGRSNAAGVRSGVNFAGCCAGPMQFSIHPRPSTWDAYGQGGDVYDPADAIPAAARYLKASGAPKDYHAAIFAYNHSEKYYRDVIEQAEKYRNAAVIPVPGDIGNATVQDVLSNPRIHLTPGQRADLRSGGIDPWLLSTMMWITERHTILITSLRKDHKPGGNHPAGRAIDIGAVDTYICRGGTSDPCATLARELAQVPSPLRSTELIYCFDPDNDPATDPGGSWTIWAQGDHCDHLHVGRDG